MSIAKIERAYVRTYRDTAATVACVEWVDRGGRPGRTEGAPDNTHMKALFKRAEREGAPITRERW